MLTAFSMSNHTINQVNDKGPWNRFAIQFACTIIFPRHVWVIFLKEKLKADLYVSWRMAHYLRCITNWFILEELGSNEYKSDVSIKAFWWAVLSLCKLWPFNLGFSA